MFKVQGSKTTDLWRRNDANRRLGGSRQICYRAYRDHSFELFFLLKVDYELMISCIPKNETSYGMNRSNELLSFQVPLQNLGDGIMS